MKKNVTTKSNETEVPTYAQELIDYFKGPILWICDNECISDDLPFAVSKQLQGKYFEKLGVVLVSNGGSGRAAYHTARILRDHVAPGGLVFLLPAQAASAATVMALSADEIIMAETATLSAIECQTLLSNEDGSSGFTSTLCITAGLDELGKEALGYMRNAASQIESHTQLNQSEVVRRATKFASSLVSPMLGRIDPEVVGSRARARDLAYQFGQRLLGLADTVPDEFRKDLLDQLILGYNEHGFPIVAQEAMALGLPVKTPDTELAQLLSNMTFLRENKERIVILQELRVEVTDDSMTHSSRHKNRSGKVSAVEDETPNSAKLLAVGGDAS